MKHVAKIKDYTKRAVAMLIIISMVVFQMVSDVVIASMSVGENGYTAIITEKLGKYGRLFEIGGQIEETSNLPDLHKGIINMLPEETEISEYSFAANMTDYTNENCIYSNGTTSFNCNMVDLKETIVSEREVNINASMLSSDEYTIIYAKSGNININVAKMDFKGILYAPNGTVTINGTEINAAGMIIAKNVNLYVDTFTMNANQYSESIVNVLELYRNDKLLTLTGYTYEDDIIVGFESDSEFARVDIYIRNDDATQFTYLTSTTESEYTISDYTFEQYMDIMAVAKTKYDETYESTLMTVGYSNDEYAEKLASYTLDADEDGILNGYEIWYSKTDHKCADSDGDGINDYVECFYLCTNPNEKNESVDTDGDGILDADEINLGTHPYLKDTDFDGWTDNEDVEPLKYNDGSQKEIDYTEDRVVGLFDKVNTWIDANGNVYQYIYNFINDNVEYTMINGVVTKYYYNTENQLIAVVTINGEERSAVTYSYNGEVLSSVAYKGFLYEFEIGENTEKIVIADNEYKTVEYNANESLTTYGDGFIIKTLYDSNGNIIEIYYDDELAHKCEYDDAGRIISVSDYIGGFELKYNYNEDGFLNETSSNKYKISYENSDEEYVINYNVLGEEYRQIIYNDIEDIYPTQYSSLLVSGVLHENVQMAEDIVEYILTKNGDKIFSNQITYKDSKIVSIKHNDGTISEILYAKDGKILGILQDEKTVIKYLYDNFGRLIREDNILVDRSYKYIYNSDNNIKCKQEYEYATGELINMLSEQIFEYENLWMDQVTRVNGEEIIYDNLGNPLKYRDNMLIKWNGKFLTSLTSNEHNIEYTYNYEGIRTSKNVDGVVTEYLIEGQDIVFEMTKDSIIAYIYDSDMNIMGMIYNDSVYYFEKNIQNDVVRIIDEDGYEICEYIYDAWGNVLSISGDENIANINPFRYRSYYYDNETGLYYVESRYYDPEIGRFVNADKIEGTIWDYTNMNMYAYCCNDPVNYYDPSGAAPIYVKTFVSRDLYSAPTSADEFDFRPYTMSMIVTNQLWMSSMNKGGSNVSYIIDNCEDFINSWNSLINATVIVINMHGTPEGMYCNNELFDVDDTKKLYYKNVKFVWLISCNTGHIEYRNENMARAIAKRVSGIVVAPDGVAKGEIKDRFYASTHEGDINATEVENWYYFSRKKNSYRTMCIGWTLYNGIGTLCCKNTIFTRKDSMSIFDLSDYLVNNGYINYK